MLGYLFFFLKKGYYSQKNTHTCFVNKKQKKQKKKGDKTAPKLNLKINKMDAKEKRGSVFLSFFF